MFLIRFFGIVLLRPGGVRMAIINKTDFYVTPLLKSARCSSSGIMFSLTARFESCSDGVRV